MDPTVESIPADKPIEVTRAVQLLLAALAIGVIQSVVRVSQLHLPGPALLVALAVAVVFFGLYLLFIVLISKGMNWARYLYLILVALGLPFTIPAYLAELRRSVVFGALSILVAVLQLAGCYLLLKKNSNLWFKTRK
jgi:hypothetical protein